MRSRFLPFYVLLFLVFGLLAFRLYDLTIRLGTYYRQLADEQRVKVRKIVAHRGIIFDRKGRPLVRNIPIYKKCELGKTACDLLSREQALKLEVEGKDADLVVEVGREYLYGESMAHLLGYLGEATEEEVRSGKASVGSLLGRTGIEQQYEDFLKGIDGGELVEVDTHGVTVRKLGKKDPAAGNDLFLSVDATLQQVAYEALRAAKGVYPEGSARGAVIATDRWGEVLALVSSPSFDPNLLTRADPSEVEKVEEILSSPEKPMFNRVVGGSYPPGSTFKIVTGSAGLEEGKITAATKIEDPGQIVIGQYRFANWYFTRYGKTEGIIGLVRSIARSTDTFFYKVGEWVGAEKLVEWGKKFGLAQLSGIDLPGEIAGFLPEPAEGSWFLGNTYHLAIGQGALGLTPLQVNQMTSVIALGGKLCQPEIKTDAEFSCKEVGLKGETIDLIREGLKQACSPGGTAGVFFDFSPPVACKTGTAEFSDPKGRTHAWLTAFVPADNPEIVVTALVEAGGEGSSVAAPIVKKVLEEWFRK